MLAGCGRSAVRHGDLVRRAVPGAGHRGDRDRGVIGGVRLVREPPRWHSGDAQGRTEERGLERGPRAVTTRRRQAPRLTPASAGAATGKAAEPPATELRPPATAATAASQGGPATQAQRPASAPAPAAQAEPGPAGPSGATATHQGESAQPAPATTAAVPPGTATQPRQGTGLPSPHVGRRGPKRARARQTGRRPATAGSARPPGAHNPAPAQRTHPAHPDTGGRGARPDRQRHRAPRTATKLSRQRRRASRR